MASPDITAAGPGQMTGLDDHIYNRLLKERIIFLGSDVRDDNANAICAQMLLLAAEDPEKEAERLFGKARAQKADRELSPDELEAVAGGYDAPSSATTQAKTPVTGLTATWRIRAWMTAPLSSVSRMNSRAPSSRHRTTALAKGSPAAFSSEETSVRLPISTPRKARCRNSR